MSRPVVRMAALILAACCMAAQTSEYKRARQLLTTGHAGEAVEIFRKLSEADPSNADLLLNLSIAEYKARDFGKAAESAAAALKLNPDLLPAYLFLGASYLEVENFTKAIDPLERVVAANPRERNARLMLGEALVGAGRTSAALDHLHAAAGMLPDNPRVWYVLGRAQEVLGRKEAARDAWNRLASLPPSLESHLHTAEVYSAEHRWREAAVQYDKALKLAPERQAIRMGLAWSLFRSQDYDAAIAVLKPVLPGERADVQFLYGASLLNRQQPVEAIPHLRAAVARDPGMLAAKAALGQGLLQTGNAAEAIPFLEEAVAVDQDGSVHFQLFRAYQLTDRRSEAQRALEGYRRIRASAAAQR